MGEDRYVGRVVAVGRTLGGQNVGMYRLSSRSVPNRQIVQRKNLLLVEPKPGFESEGADNPFVRYCAMRPAGLTDQFMVISNGLQTDLIADNIARGMSPMQSMALALALLGYERDGYNTPRIAAVVPMHDLGAVMGIVTSERTEIEIVRLVAGTCYYLATNEVTEVTGAVFEGVSTREEIAAYLLDDPYVFSHFTHPVASAAAIAEEDKWDLVTLQHS